MNQNTNQIKYGQIEAANFINEMKSYLEKNNIEMYSANNKEESIVA